MFLGDDFHHNGAFRLSYGFEYVAMMETDKSNANFQFDQHDTYEWYLKLGALSNVNRKHFKGKLPTWNDFVAHPNYDAFWKKQSLEPRLTKVTVPTLNVGGWYDQEDFRGPLQIYELLEKHDAKNQNFLVVGPWNHGGWAAAAATGSAACRSTPTPGAYFREKVQAPFFAHYLKDKGDAPPPEARMFQTGANKWESYDAWPPKNADAAEALPPPERQARVHTAGRGADAVRRVRLRPGEPGAVSPATGAPDVPRPGVARSGWCRISASRTAGPDVLTYETEPLDGGRGRRRVDEGEALRRRPPAPTATGSCG